MESRTAPLTQRATSLLQQCAAIRPGVARTFLETTSDIQYISKVTVPYDMDSLCTWLRREKSPKNIKQIGVPFASKGLTEETKTSSCYTEKKHTLFAEASSFSPVF